MKLPLLALWAATGSCAAIQQDIHARDGLPFHVGQTLDGDSDAAAQTDTEVAFASRTGEPASPSNVIVLNSDSNQNTDDKASEKQHQAAEEQTTEVVHVAAAAEPTTNNPAVSVVTVTADCDDDEASATAKQNAASPPAPSSALETSTPSAASTDATGVDPVGSSAPPHAEKSDPATTPQQKPAAPSATPNTAAAAPPAADASSAPAPAPAPSSSDANQDAEKGGGGGTKSVASPAKPSQTAVPSADSKQGSGYYEDGPIFKAISTEDVPDMFKKEDLDISTVPDDAIDKQHPTHTNKFYANLFLDTQKLQNYAQPYTAWWSNLTHFTGMAISHATFDERVYGPDPNADPVRFYINPVGIMSMVFSAKEFTESGMSLSTSDSDTFSIRATLSEAGGNVSVPLAQGMGFVTGEYSNVTPSLKSQVGFKSVEKADSPSAHDGVQKYVAKLGNGQTWGIWVSGGQVDLSLSKDKQSVTSSKKVDSAVIQVGVIPEGGDDDIDSCAGMYPVGASVDGEVKNDVGQYTIKYDVKGQSASGSTLIWALPHHVESFASDMKNKATNMTIDSTTKGLMTGYKTNELKMQETLYTSLQWLPWSEKQDKPQYSDDQIKLIKQAAQKELNQNISGQVMVPSTYTAGKAFDKYAYLTLVASDILKDDELTKKGLEGLKQAMNVFAENKQPLPLIYDTKLKGVTSSAAQNGGDPMEDFGAAYYNDHHFHYGYMVHTAAVIGYLEKKNGGGDWVEKHKDWVNALVRDVANPSKDDQHLPVFRMFDWFSGHSWASGMFSSGGGKNEESTSEDVNFAYGMKLWGQVSGDKAMEARGDLMISVTKRSLDAYFYMKDDNKNQPANFIKNKVPGITFENQVDHVTFFGTNIEYIQGIHMIPITPVSGLTRTPEFVQQEWDEKLKQLFPKLKGAWAGILRSNQAIINAKESWDYFAQDDFDYQTLDGGASRTWGLAYAAGMMGGQK